MPSLQSDSHLCISYPHDLRLYYIVYIWLHVKITYILSLQDEKPVFVFFRPEVTPQYPYLHQPYTRNQKIESLLTQLTSSPSPTALQHQLNLGNLFAQEALRLISTSQQLTTNTHLQWIGWQALLHNFSAIHRYIMCEYYNSNEMLILTRPHR